MSRRLPFFLFLALFSGTVCLDAAPAKSNVLIILADDLGYGDVQCYNPERGKIPTPSIDRLATQGMRFTDAHSSSAVCSPTRYSLLTGRYHWRTRLQSGIVQLWEQPLIAPDRMTIASLAKQQGYRTACIGKWHLGWDWNLTPEQNAHFGTDVPNWPPYAFIENDRTVGIPSELLPAAGFRGNPPLASMQGPALPGWKLEDILPTLADRAVRFVEKQAAADQPFLLYLPLTSPHTPIAVAAEWKGRSGLGPYGDFVVQTDAVVGRVLEALEKSGAADRTLVIFTSDNGCAPTAAPKLLEEKGHFSSGPLRGRKADPWEGGHRIPFIVRWPGVVKAGTTSHQTLCSVDIMATLAEIWETKLPEGAGEDSTSLLPLFKGEEKPVHEAVVHQSAAGVFAIREGRWKLIFGGQGATGPGAKPGETPSEGRVQLYDLEKDLAETSNLQTQEPDTVARLTALMEKYIAQGRSTPGPSQANDVPIKLFKPARAQGKNKPE